nr:hypothetical protein [Tanacetum cinerariifolium]
MGRFFGFLLIFQDFLNTSESSNDNTNVVNAPQEPFVFNQDPGENSSQSPPHIDHHCCYGCGDSLDGIFCQRCTYESCGNGAHIGYNCPSKVPIIFNPEPCYNQNVDEFPQTLPSFHLTCYSRDENSFPYDSTPNFVDDSPNVFNPPSQPRHDDDEDYTIAITPVLPTEEPVDSLIMDDEHLDTIPATKSYEVIKSRIEDLVLIPSESEGIPDNMHRPPIFELVSLEEVKDDILREKLLNTHLLIAKIESLNENPTLDRVLKSPSPFPIPVEDSDSFFEKSDTSLSYSDNSLPEFETFSNHTKETSSGSTTTHVDYSLPEYDSFIFEIEPDQGELTSVVMEDILGEPHVQVPNVLPTHPTLYLDTNFTPSDDSLGSDLEVSFLSGTRNNIFDPGIFFEVQSKNFLSRDTFYISFNRDPLCLVIETLLPFSSENEDQVFNPGILSSNLLSHRGKITSGFLRTR